MHYLLHTFATPSAIRNDYFSLQTISQSPNQTKVEYSARVNEAVYCYINVHDEVDKMTFLTNGLSPSIQTIFVRYRETQPRRLLTYNALVQFARDEGEAFRARTRLLREISNPRNLNTNTTAVNILQETISLDQSHDEDVNLLGGDNDSALNSIPTADLPSTEERSEEVMFVLRSSRDPRNKRRDVLCVNFSSSQNTPNHVGLGDIPVPICHTCYQSGHFSPD